jgi:hypothetical protein
LFGAWSPRRRHQAGLAVPNVRQRIDPGEALSRNRAFPSVWIVCIFCNSRTVMPPSAKFGRPGALDSSVDCVGLLFDASHNSRRGGLSMVGRSSTPACAEVSIKGSQLRRMDELGRGFAGLTRERAWSILAGLYQIAANPFPGPRLNTKSVPQGMQTNQHHARSMLHPRARAWRQVWWLTVSSPLHQADASVAVGRSIRRRRKASAYSRDRKVWAYTRGRKAATGRRDVWASRRLFQRPRGMVR